MGLPLPDLFALDEAEGLILLVSAWRGAEIDAIARPLRRIWRSDVQRPRRASHQAAPIYQANVAIRFWGGARRATRSSWRVDPFRSYTTSNWPIIEFSSCSSTWQWKT